MQALKSFISDCAWILGPVGTAVTVLVPCTVALCFRWLAGPLSVWAWVGVAIALLLLVPVLAVATSVLRVTVFAPDWVERYPNGKVRARGPHYHGDRQEHWTFWHEDGWKECEGKYIQGFESETWTFYHPNGRVCARGELDGWCRQGAWEFWDDTGHPITESAFLARYSRPPRQVNGRPVERFPPRADESAVRESSRAEPNAAADRSRDPGSS